MKMKKRRVRDFLLAGSLILGMMLTGCGMSGQQTEQNGGKEQNKVENEKISVVATIFPQYDFVRQIAGENVELKMLSSVAMAALSMGYHRVFDKFNNNTWNLRCF